MEKNKLSLKLEEFFKKVIIIDASVLIKEILEENGSDLVDELVQAHLKGELTLMSTPLLTFEFFNVISRAIADDGEVKVAFQRFKKMKIGKLDPDDKNIYWAITNVCKNSKISYYDASYHALAKSLDGIFLTADERYYDLMKHEGNIQFFSMP